MKFESWQSFWNFRREVATKARYLHSDSTKEFLAALKESAKNKVISFDEGQILWRAQVGCLFDEIGEPQPFDKQRMLPLKDEASEGRINPKGIPCLYAANKIETAIAEVRPWIGAEVSVAMLKTKRPLSIVDCTEDLKGKSMAIPAIMNPEDPLTEEEIETEIWNQINQAFSEPLENGDSRADYAPTQIMSELFRSSGYTGIGYKSALGDGLNIAIFDPQTVEVISCQTHTVRSVKFTSEPSGNPAYYKPEK